MFLLSNNFAMKNIVNILICLMLGLSTVCGCSSDIAVYGIALDATAIELSVGGNRQLAAAVYPADLNNYQLEWKSDNESVVRVDEDGVVTAVALGEAVVSVECEGYEALCYVTVNSDEIEAVALNKTKISIIKGESEQLRAIVHPSGVDSGSLVWLSSAPDVASILQDGTVKGINPGTAEISVNAGDKQAVCVVEVLPVQVESVALNIQSVELVCGGAVHLSAKITPVYSDYDALTWTSSAEGVVSVSDEGIVNALSVGKAVITAVVSGVEAQCNVTVLDERECKVGDIYYSDGSYSEYPDPNKEAIGVVFWTEDPSVDDPTLRKDHPECVNGLVIGLKEYSNDFQQNFSDYHRTIGEWVVANRPDLMDTRVKQDPENLNNYTNNIIVGYNNTKAYEAFNAAPENSEYLLSFIEDLEAFREEVPAPENTSGWYLPSAKELAILRTANDEYNINTILDIPDGNNLTFVNSKIMHIDGAPEIRTVWGHYSSSTEFDWETNFILLADNGAVIRSRKMSKPSLLYRFVLAF